MKGICLILLCLLIPVVDSFGQTEVVLRGTNKKLAKLNFVGTTGSTVITKIQVYSTLDDPARLNFKKPELSSIPLNRRAYYQLAAQTLMRAGWVESDSSQNILTLTTNIDDGTSVNYSYSTPQYGQVATGSTSANSKVTVNPYSNSATVKTTTVPKTTVGVVGYNNTSGTTTTFKREIVISIVNQTSQSEEYRYELTSSGFSNDLNDIAPYMFSAIPIIHNKVYLCCYTLHNWKTQYNYTFSVGTESVYGKQFTW